MIVEHIRRSTEWAMYMQPKAVALAPRTSSNGSPDLGQTFDATYLSK